MIFKGYFCSTVWFCDSMILCQKTNATAFYPSSRSEKDRARLQESHHSIALLNISATSSHILKDLNAHTSCTLQRPKKKKKRKDKKRMTADKIRYWGENLLNIFSTSGFYNCSHVEKITIAWWVHHQNKTVLTKMDRLIKFARLLGQWQVWVNFSSTCLH